MKKSEFYLLFAAIFVAPVGVDTVQGIIINGSIATFTFIYAVYLLAKDE